MDGGFNTAQNINAIAVAFAGAVSAELSANETALLAAFFTVVGDALGTIAAARTSSSG